MSTGEEFRQAAADLRGLAAEMRDTHTSVDRDWNDAVTGCLLATTISTTVDTSRDVAAAITAQLEAIADQCDIRARICDRHDADLRTYRTKLSAARVADARRLPGDPATRWPSAPKRPAPWVTPSV